MTKTMKAVLVLFIIYSVVSTAVNWRTMSSNTRLESEVAALKDSQGDSGAQTTELTDALDEAKRAGAKAEMELENALTSLEAANKDNEELKSELAALKEKFGYDPSIEWTLSRSGLTIEEVENSLKEHPEVIGQDAVLGGRMGFNRVMMLTPNWVFGQFEDGHVLGWGIYEYQHSKGVFTWREIASILDGDIHIGK